MFINWNGGKVSQDHAQLVSRDEVHIVLKFFEENKLALYAIDLNKELCRLIFTHRKFEINLQLISPLKISLAKKSNSKGSESKQDHSIPEDESIFRISRCDQLMAEIGLKNSVLNSQMRL
jgi:hypothetical protein